MDRIPHGTTLSSRHRKARFMMGLLLSMLMVLALSMVTFADGEGVNNLADAVKKATGSGYQFTCTIASALAAVILAVRGIRLVIGGKNAMETFKESLGWMLIALIAIWCAPLIISTLKSWFGGLNGDNVNKEIFGTDFTAAPTNTPR